MEYTIDSLHSKGSSVLIEPNGSDESLKETNKKKKSFFLDESLLY